MIKLESPDFDPISFGAEIPTYECEFTLCPISVTE